MRREFPILFLPIKWVLSERETYFFIFLSYHHATNITRILSLHRSLTHQCMPIRCQNRHRGPSAGSGCAFAQWSSFKVGFRSCRLLRSLKKLGSLKEHAGFPHWRTLRAEINGFTRLIRRSQVFSTKSSATRSVSVSRLLPFTYICDSENSFAFSHLFVHPQAGVSSGRR